MKATCKPYLYAKRLKESGKYPVKLRVIYNRVFRFYGIGVDMTKEEFDGFHLNKKLRHQADDIAFFTKRAEKIIEGLKDEFSWDRFEKDFLSKKIVITPNSNDIFESLLNYRDALIAEEQIKTSISYQTTHNSFEEFIALQNGKTTTAIKKSQKDKIKIAKLTFLDVNTQVLKDYEKYLRNKELSTASIGIYMRNLRTVYNKAIEDKLVPSEAYPFGKNKFSPPASTKTKKALTIDEIGKIYYYKTQKPKEEWARDMWIFAYLSNGLNIKDVAYLKNKNIVLDEIHLIREKTKHSKRETEKKIVILVTKEMKEIIKKWGNTKKGKDDFIFNLIRENATAFERVRDVEQAIKSINLYVARIGKNLNLSVSPTSGLVRHSYATILKRAGIPIEMISEQLGHGSVKTTEIYLGSFEKEQRQETIKHLTAFTLPKKKVKKVQTA